MEKLLITGGTGSLGRALLGHVFEYRRDIQEVVVYSRDEVKQAEVRHRYPDARYMLGDVRDLDRLMIAMRGCDTVVHAGAYKQIPSAEANVDEAIATNVVGSLNVARAAVHLGVESVVGISTDKACMPVNAYGATKSLMEKLFQQADDWSDTTFTLVRYGNVLWSRGSILPLFLEQAQNDKPYTITDPNMTRFWMTLDDAVQLVMRAADIQDTSIESGVILVPQCKSSDMMTLLQAFHSWFTVDEPLGDNMWEIIGARAGEKQHEMLIHANEGVHTRRPDRLPYFQILPSGTAERHEPLVYTSEDAERLSVEVLVDMMGPNEYVVG